MSSSSTHTLNIQQLLEMSFEKRALATLAFFDLFLYGLNFDELKKYFIGALPKDELLLKFLNGSAKIKTEGGFYFLHSSEANLAKRQEYDRISDDFWKHVRKYAKFLRFVPFLKTVAVCNTLAFGTVTEKSDIDLFIIAKKGRLFIVRCITVLVFGLLGVRRHGSKIARRFCLSFYIDDEHLNLQPIHFGADDIYFYYWFLTLVPLVDFNTFKKLQNSNRWLYNFFEQLPGKDPQLVFINNRFFTTILEKLLNGKLGNFFEQLVRKIQFKRHEKRFGTFDPKASLVVSDYMLKFHNIDRREEIQRRFFSSLTNLFL